MEEKITKKRQKQGDDGGFGYRDAGVDIDAGDAFVEAIRPLAETTMRPGVMAGLGGFGGLFDLKATGYADPVLVAATDGVGTKLLVAEAAGEHAAVGVDLVAMCVNDVVAEGAEPVLFMDYLATGKLDVAAMREVVAGVAEGCRQAGCALIGGETAEMPGMYAPGRYDLAGFALGVVERAQIFDRSRIMPGDAVLGVASSGLHSNGFSLVRKVVEKAGLDYAGPAPFDGDRPLGRALLDPTRIYVKSCLKALKTGGVRGLAHITGGGLVENLPRVLPDGLVAVLDADAWALPPVFEWLVEAGGIAPADMARTFNCGIGMAVIAEAGKAELVTDTLLGAGELVLQIGVVETADQGEAGVVFENLEAAWKA